MLNQPILSGWMNKAMVASSHLMPDTMIATNMHKMMEPADESKKE